MNPEAQAGAPAAVDLVIRGGWLIALNPQREIFRDGAGAGMTPL